VRNTRIIVAAAASLATLLLCGCTPQPTRHGVYRSGPNAIIAGSTTEGVTLWGGDGMATRTPTPGPKGTTLVGAAGPLWRTDKDIAAPAKPPTVPAALVERAGIRVKAVLGTSGTPSVDAARPGAQGGGNPIRRRQGPLARQRHRRYQRDHGLAQQRLQLSYSHHPPSVRWGWHPPCQ
jgi:hypothetical protein